jgi:hypothetical protein
MARSDLRLFQNFNFEKIQGGEKFFVKKIRFVVVTNKKNE